MKIRNVLVIPFLLLVLTAVSCGNSKSRNDRTETVDKEVIKAPEFEDRKSTRLNSSHSDRSRMPSSA